MDFSCEQKETGMRPGLRLFLGTVLGIALFFTAALVMGDELTQTITSRNLATFDDPATNGNWIVQGSKYATQGFPQMQLVRAWPEALYGKNRDSKTLFALGVHAKFDRKSYNYIEIIPAAKDSSGKLQPKAIPIPGRVRSIDMWVWGANYNYTLDAHLRDYQGIDHVLHLGSLQFAGWKNSQRNDLGRHTAVAHVHPAVRGPGADEARDLDRPGREGGRLLLLRGRDQLHHGPVRDPVRRGGPRGS